MIHAKVGDMMLRICPPENGQAGFSQPGLVVEVSPSEIALDVQADIRRQMRFERVEGFDTTGMGSFIVRLDAKR